MNKCELLGKGIVYICSFGIWCVVKELTAKEALGLDGIIFVASRHVEVVAQMYFNAKR